MEVKKEKKEKDFKQQRKDKIIKENKEKLKKKILDEEEKITGPMKNNQI